MSTHNICFHGEIRKILCGYPLLSVAMGPFLELKSCIVVKLKWVSVTSDSEKLLYTFMTVF